MYIKSLIRIVIFVAVCSGLVGCSCLFPLKSYPRVTHVATLRNIGSEDAYDVILYFGSAGYKMGDMPPEVAKHRYYRTGDAIPEHASAEWRREDGSIHKGTVTIKRPEEFIQIEHYIIQFDDNNELSLIVEDVLAR